MTDTERLIRELVRRISKLEKEVKRLKAVTTVPDLAALGDVGAGAVAASSVATSGNVTAGGAVTAGGDVYFGGVGSQIHLYVQSGALKASYNGGTGYVVHQF